MHVMDLFKACLKLLKQYRTIEKMCSDAHSITLILRQTLYKPNRRCCQDVESVFYDNRGITKTG